ncbi:hypothetical protein [Rhodospirillum centenum]|uniref:Uncharacterized protein n=1 Tax=Rhodospirillum centenum (strain ATCC 51521 / SW) TaxID=414684 RepID=B6IYJ8_RHOCS|nr:hypothetical protein [Rhodospirillum centenum]ACJ01372.1 hypothetical protein RC1_4031 [Rhodospirillum centenum SW]
MVRTDGAGGLSPTGHGAGLRRSPLRRWRRYLLPAVLLLLALPPALDAGRRLPASLAGVQAEALTATWKATGADADWEAALAARERQLTWFPDPVAQQRTARLLLDRAMQTGGRTGMAAPLLERARLLAEASLSRGPADGRVWALLAHLSFLREDDPFRTVDLLRLSILTSPADPGLAFWRVDLALRLRPYWGETVEELLQEQFRLAFAWAERDFVTLVLDRDALLAVQQAFPPGEALGRRFNEVAGDAVVRRLASP